MTMIEILVVLALVVIVGTLALMVSFDTYRDSSFHADRAQVLAALQHARALSVDDVCDGSGCTSGVPHGVSIQSHEYVVFQGASYAARDPSLDEVIDANPAIARAGLLEVVFDPETGDVSLPGTITLADTSGHTSIITIGEYGQLLWSK